MNVYLKKQNLFWQKVGIEIAILFLVIVLLNIFQAQIKNSFFAISSPISSAFLQAGNNSSSFFNSFVSFKSLKQENSNLKDKNQQLLSEIINLQDTIRGNEALSLAVQNTKGDDYQLMLASVIGLDLTDDSITINEGSADGVSQNMPVVSNEKVVYGMVTNVYAHFSKVRLISSKKSTLDVKIQDSDLTKPAINGAVKGQGNLSVYLDLVDSGADIKNGDTLLTSGLEGFFPKDLLVGTITSINKNDLKAFQTAQVHPFFDVKNHPNLFVITHYKR